MLIGVYLRSSAAISDFFTASHGRGSDWGFTPVHFYVAHPTMSGSAEQVTKRVLRY
jgi:hypothetical protein